MNESDLDKGPMSSQDMESSPQSSQSQPQSPPVVQNYQMTDEEKKDPEVKFAQEEDCCGRCCDGCINCCLGCFIPGCWAITFGVCCCGLCRGSNLPML